MDLYRLFPMKPFVPAWESERFNNDPDLFPIWVGLAPKKRVDGQLGKICRRAAKAELRDIHP